MIPDINEIIAEHVKAEVKAAYKEGFKYGRMRGGLIGWSVADLRLLEAEADAYVDERMQANG